MTALHNIQKKTSDKTQEKPKGKQENSTSSLCPEPALKPATLGMITNDEERTKKEERRQLFA